MFENSSYKAQLKELYGYKRLGIRPSLPPVQKLLEALLHPERLLQFIHVAGTNGKGSTTAYLSSILREAGYKVGSFYSPHVADYRERIQINGKMIAKKAVVEELATMGHIYKEAKRNGMVGLPEQITFFEWTTALAFFHFATAKVDIAVMETGMGGRFDATNVINPLASVITNISLEHSSFLGNSKAKIAMEKSGIIKRGKPVISGERSIKPADVIRGTAVTKECRYYFLGKEFTLANNGTMRTELSEPLTIAPSIPGRHQQENAAVAAEAILAIKAGGELEKVQKKHIEDGIKKATLVGRFEEGKTSKRKLLFDVAHNPASMQALVDTLAIKYPQKKWNVVFGLLRGKDAARVLKIIAPVVERMVCITPQDFRAAMAGDIAKIAKETGIKNVKAVDNEGLLKFMGANSKPLLITGSFTVVEAGKKLLPKL